MPIANLNQKLPSLGSIVVGGASPLENRQPLIVAPDLPLVEVISLMSQAKGQTCLLPSSNSTPSTALEISAAARHSSVLVIADRRLVGIFTERDLVKLTASQTDLQRVTVGDVMTIDPIALELSENHTVMTALGLFQQHQIRHLPILDDRQQLIGIVTPEHIRQVLQPINLLKFKSVSEGMTTEVIHALPTATVLEVAQMMNDRNIGSIVIVDGQEQLKPVGIVTEGDLVQFQAFELDLDQLLVATVMSSPLFCLQPTDSLWAAQQVMQTKQIRQLVITNDRGELAGILTRSNLLQLFDPLETIYMVEHLQSQLIELATQLEQTNRELQAEAARRAQVEAELRRASQTREAPVTARTDELALLTAELHLQIVGQQAALRERQQAEEDLVRFNQALSHAMEGIALLDLQGHYLQINQAYADTVGYKPEAMVGMDWQQTLHPDDLANMQIAYQHMQAHGKVEVSARGIRSDGSIFYKQLVMVTNYNSQQQQIGHYCFMKDISAAKQAEVDLIHSERKFRAIFDNTFQFVGLLDVDGKLLEANRTALEAIGVTSDEVVGQLFWATPWWTHSPDLQVQLQQAIDLAATGELVRFEAKHFLANGSFVIVDFSLSPIKDETGKVVMLIPEGRDITDRKGLEQEREQFLAVGSDLQLILGSNGYFQWVSPTFESTLGWTTAEMTSRQWTEFVHPDDITPSVAEKTSVFDGNELIAFENRYRHKDGSYRWFSWNAQPNSEKQVIYAVAMDITERKDKEQKIQEQAALLDIATDAILVRDLDNRVQFWNKGAESIYGWQATEAIGRKTTELFYTDVPPETTIAGNAVRQQGAWQGELNKLTKAGKAVTVQSRWTLVRDAAGNQISILSVDTDITQKKSLEQQFLRAQRLESLGSLASGIAHDLNNVLTPIVGAAQLLPLTLPNLDARNQRLLNMLVDSSERGSSLVKQILTFARGMDGERTVLQMRHILAEIISVARQTFPKSIEINLNLASEDLWLVNVDGTQIHQVLMNLYVNARDAMPNGGSLTASAENIAIDAADPQLSLQLPAGSYLVIRVVDTGIGMTTEMLDRIFEPFFTTKETGTGLGLSTVLGIVKAHGGSIEVESEVGRGTCFKIYLPAILPWRGSANDSRETETSPTARDSHDGKGQLILVVDDEAAIREIAKESLEAYNYRVILASDGIEAIDIVAKNHSNIAIVLIDMMMPNLDTRSTIQALQQIDSQLKIVVMSGSYHNLESAIERENVSIVLTKPFTTADLLQALTNIQIE